MILFYSAIFSSRFRHTASVHEAKVQRVSNKGENNLSNTHTHTQTQARARTRTFFRQELALGEHCVHSTYTNNKRQLKGMSFFFIMLANFLVRVQRFTHSCNVTASCSGILTQYYITLFISYTQFTAIFTWETRNRTRGTPKARHRP